jgi:hypothetical protein
VKRIFKYPIPMEVKPEGAGWDPETVVELPMGSKILTIQVQGNHPMIWAEVDLSAFMNEKRKFMILNTGAVIPEDKKLAYISTVQFNNGALIFHVYEVLS